METIVKLESLVIQNQKYDDKDIEMFYADYRRRVELLKAVLNKVDLSLKWVEPYP